MFRRLVVLLAIPLLGVAIPAVILALAAPLGRHPVILMVGDLDRPDSLGSQVMAGVREAMNPASQERPLPVTYVAIAEPVGGRSREATEYALAAYREELHRRLSHEFAVHDVVAIISANTSPTAPFVLDAARVFNVPVMLTVATNVRLLSPSFKGVAFRMPPTDTKQAEAIVDWVKGLPPAGGGARVGVMYDPLAYGTDLLAAVTERLSLFDLVPFPLRSTSDINDILAAGIQGKFNAWIFLGYRSEAVEAVIKRRVLGIHEPLLLSDGALGAWLRNVADPSVLIVSPSVLSQAERGSLKGYHVYGRDAYLLLRQAILGNQVGISRRSELPENLRSLARTMPGLTMSYDFVSGENEAAVFAVRSTAELAEAK